MMSPDMLDQGRPKRILLLAETGFIIRNLLLGYFADEITRDFELTVAVQNPQDSNLQEIASKNKRISLIDFPFEPYLVDSTSLRRFWSWDNWIYGVRSAERNNISLKIQTRLFEQASVKKRLMRFAPFLMGKILVYLGLSAWIEDVYLSSVLKRRITREWSIILEHTRPSLVFSTMLTHSTRFRCSTDLPAAVAAHHKAIPVCTLVQSWDNLSSKNSILPVWIMQYFTWSRSMTDELLQLNPRIQPSQISIVGSPQYDYHTNAGLIRPRDVFMREIGLNPDFLYILIGTGTAQWMPDEMEKMVQLAHEIRRQCAQVQVMIRLHPKDDGKRWQPFRTDLANLGVIIQYTSPVTHMDEGGFTPPAGFYSDQVNAIYHSAIVINSSSSLTIDAAIFDKPVICVAYDLKSDTVFPNGRSMAYTQSVHYSKLVETGGVWVVKSVKECMEAIGTYIKDPALHRRERKLMVDLITDSLDQKAGIRLAEGLKENISQRADINL